MHERSIVMVDWSRNNTPTVRSRDEFLWQQLLLSLLYDEILASDETVICSQDMATWFSKEEDFLLLQEVIECGGLKLLKRPIHKFPEKYRERAVRTPVAARKDYLETQSVDNNGNFLKFGPEYDRFHMRLDILLRDMSFASRFSGSKNLSGANIMQEFGTLLTQVLIGDNFKEWLNKNHPEITDEIANDFVLQIANPELSLSRLIQSSNSEKSTFLKGIKPEWNTALAVQVAATYPKPAAAKLGDIIESVFARPFCQDEKASGRYGRQLQSLPFEKDLRTPVDSRKVKIVDVQTIPVLLPQIKKGTARIVRAIKDKESGRRLRKVMSTLDDTSNLNVFTAAWNDVADDLARSMTSSQLSKAHIKTLAVETATSTFVSVIASLLSTAVQSADPGTVGGLLVGMGVGAAMDFGSKLMPIQVEAQKQRRQLQEPLRDSINFTCVEHPFA